MLKKILVLFTFCSVIFAYAHTSSHRVNEYKTLPFINLNTELVVESQTSYQTKGDFDISPNPARHSLNIKVTDNSFEMSVQVFDVLGKLIYRGQITSLEHRIDITNWKSGIYLVKVSSKKNTLTKRFIKQ